MKRYHYFTYYAPAKSTTKSDPRGDFHRFRDPYVLLNLAELLRAAGFEYGTIIANVPKDMQQIGGDRLVFVDPELAERDLIAVPTRSPLSESDPEILPKRSGVRRSFLYLENEIFAGLAGLFGRLDRERAILADGLVKRAGPFGEIQFHQNTRNGHTGGCVLRFGNGTEPPNPIAVGYVATIPRLQSCPCRILSVFGMGGFETLVLSYVLRHRLSDLIMEMLKANTPRIALVSFAIPETVPFPLVSFDMDRLNAKVVFDSA
jgi:hypothetical protein